MSDEKEKLEEEMMTVAAVAGIGAGGQPNGPPLSFRDEPPVNQQKRLAMFRRQLRRKRQVW